MAPSRSLVLLMLLLTLATANKVADEAERLAQEVETNGIDEVKHELDRAAYNLKSSHAQEGHAINPNPVGNVVGSDACTSVDCNNRGTCIGSKTAFLCACQLGFSGRSCEETVCESTRDCNGRGLCIGTTSSLTCLCNLGFSGPRCETVH